MSICGFYISLSSRKTSRYFVDFNVDLGLNLKACVFAFQLFIIPYLSAIDLPFNKPILFVGSDDSEHRYHL